MTTRLPCPDAGVLQRLLLGQINSPEADPLEDHLATCGRCIETIQQLNETDSLVEALRGQAGVVPKPPGAEVEALMERLCALPMSLAGSESGPSKFPHTTPPPLAALSMPARSADPPPSV